VFRVALSPVRGERIWVLLVADKSSGERHEMKVIEIAFSCYPVKDLKRARQFYEGTLGLKESRVFGDSQRAGVEYDIGPGTLAISNPVLTGIHLKTVVASVWKWMTSTQRLNISKRAASSSAWNPPKHPFASWH
jgi:hypothetical protein